MTTRIVRASPGDIDAVARLFDLYRQFYDCEPDLATAREFIAARIRNDQSVIFLSVDRQGKARGFVQMYPSFCSVEAVNILILYDLYVDADNRKQGIGETLMKRATEYASETGVARLDLLTAKTNVAGQALYEKLGYRRVNRDFYAYSLEVE